MTDMSMLGLVVYSPVAAYLRKGRAGELSTALAGLEFLLGETYSDTPIFPPQELKRQIAAHALKLRMQVSRKPVGDLWAYKVETLAEEVLAELAAGSINSHLN